MPLQTSLFQTMRELHGRGEAFVCVTTVDPARFTETVAGSKMIVTRAGRVCGSLGGGQLEESALKRADEILGTGATAEVVRWDFPGGPAARLVFEPFYPASWQIVIFGAGHVSQALTKILAGLNCRVTVFDTRPAMLAALVEAPNIDARLADPLEEAVGQIPEGAFVALMTQGHRSDKPVLERILKTRAFPYLGVIGSASKAAVLRRELRESGVPDDLLYAFRCPLGLPIGKDCPEEIAISIAAELLQTRGS